MKRILSIVLCMYLCSITILGDPVSATAATWEENYCSGQRSYTSASLVTSLYGDVSSITPSIYDDKIPYGVAPDYLSITGPLSVLGPLSAYGPLGTMGPVGNNMWSPSYWISGSMNWSDWSEEITGMGGPLSAMGPLGENGPLGTAYYNASLFEQNDFARHSRGLGVWSPLGPIGPLGALGPLGPLGPIGTHGYSRNSNGEYTNNGQVVRDKTIWFDADHTIQRTYPLYENYSESFAKSKKDNDTSFMVEGSASIWDNTDTYSFTSAEDQLVTILVTNTQLLWAGDDFDLTITDQHGNKLITSNNSSNWVDWIQLKVPAGTTLNAEVRLASPLSPMLFTSYRLFVTGSTHYANSTEISGDHIAIWS